MKVLFIWEWGTGAGHLRRFAPIADHLTSAGHQVVIVSRNLRTLPTYFPAKRYRWLVAPVVEGRPAQRVQSPATIADIAWNLGWDHADSVIALVRVWCELLRWQNPDVVISDFGVAGAAVARSLDLPCLRIGTGYTCPPAASPLVRMHGTAGMHGTAMDHCSTEAVILTHLNTALHKAGLRDGRSWCDLIVDDQRTLLATTPLLDPYREARRSEAYGGVWDTLEGAPVRWNGKATHRAFAYLKRFRNLPALWDALQRAGVATALVGDGLVRQHVPARYTPTVQWQDSLVDLTSLGGNVRFAVCNANHGTTTRLLSLGIPILAIPLFYEQQLTARRIQSNGWGVVCDPNEPNQFGAAIDRLLGDDGFAKRCIAAAAQLDFGTNAFNEATKWFDERMETLH